MCDDKRKMYPKKETGTVPKTKYRNKNDPRYNYQNASPKNSHVSCVRESDPSKLYTNSDLQKKNILKTHYYMMEHSGNEENTKQNSIISMSNGSVSSRSTSTSASRRNSVGASCNNNDNTTKYPDKKQIEDKLNQIKEYIQTTSSLISNMKNTDEQSNADEVTNLMDLINNLKDSERKLTATLSAIELFEAEQANNESKEFSENEGEHTEGCTTGQGQNEIEKRVLQANREIEKLQQDNLLLNLQIKAENQMRNAVRVQQQLMQQSSKEINHTKNSIYPEDTNDRQHQLNSLMSDSYTSNALSIGSNKQLNETHHENIKDIEDRLKQLNDSQASIVSSIPSSSNLQDSLVTQIDSINDKIGYLRDVNDQGAQLIQLLDNRDLQLHNEHTQLQAKLKDLQEKKLQVDNLVLQLETMNEESEEEEVPGDQVHKIVTMKQQLEKLKSILEVVKNTETLIERQQQNYNESDNEITLTSENSNIQPQICSKTDNLRCSKNKTHQDNKAGSNVSSKELKNQKQSNKSKLNFNERERMKLQSELQAKKRELEELMFKHKAVTSNLNQDFHIDNKPDHTLLENESNTWYPMPNLYNIPPSEYSSDECAEEEEQSPENSTDNNKVSPQVPAMPSLNYAASNYIKRDLDTRIDSGTEYSHLSSKRPTNSRNSLTTAAQSPARSRDTSCPNNNSELDKYQIQKQLELIRSVCDTMLDDHNSCNSQVRNNLTPSSIYTEPRQYESTCSQNANINTHQSDSLAFPIQNVPSNDINYQNWLATNTLQTQAFMLNTLNQCCQMLWLQQREIASLRNTVNALQERMQCETNMSPFLPTNQMLNMETTSVSSRQNVPHIRSSVPNPKVNHVSSATSMPNLNQMQQISQTNIDTSAAVAYANNLHNARLIDTNSLNNNTFSGVNSNTVLHGTNQHLPSQIWNGQGALNNQVAPGNRANNYWDNFRSYSRQNLLSTKTNEGLQNFCSVTDGGSRSSSNCTERSHYNSFPFQPTTLSSASSKTNISNSIPTGLPPVVCSRRARTLFKIPHVQNTNILTNVPPPDVLNVNQIQNTSIKCSDAEIVDGTSDVLEVPLPLLNTVDHHFQNDGEVASNAIVPESTLNNLYVGDSNLSTSMNIAATSQQDHLKNWRRQINRNEWHEEATDNSNIKSKLFEALRENVYKEVASLISANQGRPHFLIQLFRDLQLISSDPLRRQTLQSIQSLITQAQAFDEDPMPSHSEENLDDVPTESTEATIPEYLNAAVLFLKKHADDKLHNDLLEAFKKLLIDTTFSIVFANIKDDVIQKHFVGLINETMEQFRNKTIKDVKLILIHTIEELYRGEISFLRLMRDNLIENHIGNEVTFEVPKLFDCNNVAPQQQQIQNADLAEADQSHIDVDEEDDDEDNNEEGAVGGLLSTERGNISSNQVNPDDVVETKGEYPGDNEVDAEYTEGLDQVPTRLTRTLKLTGSSSNTKN